MRQAGGGRTSQFPIHEAINMSANGATWNSERVELLKSCFDAGLSCSQIARKIGVTRNAVIGKVSRLGLSRPKDTIIRQLRDRRAQRSERSKALRLWYPRVPRGDCAVQQEMPGGALGETRPWVEVIPIPNGRGCTLLELDEESCRWPINTPGAADFCFCGNEPVKGLPYCPGHARMAYRPAGRRLSSA